MTFRDVLVILNILIFTSCTIPQSVLDIEELKIAACTSQAFLKDNGYVERLESPDTASITLSLWDDLKYSSNGEIDFDRLLKDREGLFSNNLYGVAKFQGYYLVYYSFKDSFGHWHVCTNVNENRGYVVLNEANCHLNENVHRLNEARLICDDDQ